ncbi:MAG: helix-turn-helix transcriptional regulator, partial [Nitrospirae bacterium]|nr:helix-turn-helix transcriptional regulator [Nitrospirota bacterium]
MARRDELVQNFDIQLVNRKGKKLWLNVTTLLENDSSCPVGSNIVHIFRQTASPVALENYFKQNIKDWVDTSLKDQEMIQLTQKGNRWVGIAKKFYLSPREIEVFQNLVQGHGTLEIAEILHLSPTTVRTHVQRILKKL